MNNPVVAMKLRIPNAPSMPLDRLDRRLDGVFDTRLAIVTAPAGSGKTALLTRLAARANGPVGWYRAEGWDADEEALLRHIEAALAPILDGVSRDWSSVESAANALASWDGHQALLIIDDLHTLRGTAAEAALERLIGYAPPSIHFAIASRDIPNLNLSRLRVAGELLEFSSDDLRFRSWEVEHLFRDFYGEPLPPEELARLARRTEGWAAGLQLFHLATRGQTADERRRMLAQLNGSTRLMREYLARNVLHQLPDDLRRFLIDTAVLGRLSGTLCDRLLERNGSAEILLDLQRRRLFIQSLPEEGEYRYHEVLRTYLLGMLLDELGETNLHARFSAAGDLLADVGAATEALEAYCRAEDWVSARRVLEERGSMVAEGSTEWLETLPGSIVRHDPWLLLASARRARAEGRLREAAVLYQDAESAFGMADAAQLCRDERNAISSWFDGQTRARLDPLTLIRASVRGEPLSVRADAAALEPASASLVVGLAALVAGNVASARGELVHAAERPDASRSVVVVASLGAGVAAALMGQPHATLEIEGAIAAAESAGIDWLARMGRAALALTGKDESIREASVLASTSLAIGDDWGAMLCRLASGWGSLVAQQPTDPLDDLVATSRALDAPAMEAWTRSIVALAAVRAGEPDSREDALAAVRVAQSLSVDGARMVAYLALAETAADPIEADEQLSEVVALVNETGLHPPGGTVELRDAGAAAPSTAESAVAIHLFGGFELIRDGQPSDLGAIRPRARALLRLLALNTGRLVHHESIEAALWPDADAQSSARNLHVAVAALRRIIEPSAMRGTFQLIRRDGDAYVLSVPDGSRIDLLDFDAALARGHRARSVGDDIGAEAAYTEALSLYRGELLPEDGPADWVAERRESCRLAAVDATQAMAEILLARGDAAGAARVSSTGLRIERYHDPLWRLLIKARDQAGDQGAARAARLGYDRMLAELGVTPSVGS